MLGTILWDGLSLLTIKGILSIKIMYMGKL